MVWKCTCKFVFTPFLISHKYSSFSVTSIASPDGGALTQHALKLMHSLTAQKRETLTSVCVHGSSSWKQNQFLPHHLIPAAIKTSVFTFPLIKGANTAHWTRFLCWYITCPQTSTVNTASHWVLPTPSVSTFKKCLKIQLFMRLLSTL